MTLPASTDVLIVGGGLAGLRLADLLNDQGYDYQLIEARNRLGGRVLGYQTGGATFDLGPAWFWPAQPRIAALTDRFQLDIFEQYASGDFTFEDAEGIVQQGQNIGSMQGSLRLNGAISSLCDALHAELEKNRAHVDIALKSCTKTPSGILATCAGGKQITAQHVVLTLPPRVAAGLQFSPTLPDATIRCMQRIPTWMAGQAKALAIYETPFWRTAGLSGDAVSHRGPMVEIHDASPDTGGPFALFGFIGTPPHQRADTSALKIAILAQLYRLFGPNAPEPADLIVKDWASDPETTTTADLAGPSAHPHYGLPASLDGLWEGNLIFGGTEVAPEFGGYLEGALAAAEQAFESLSNTQRGASSTTFDRQWN